MSQKMDMRAEIQFGEQLTVVMAAMAKQGYEFSENFSVVLDESLGWSLYREEDNEKLMDGLELFDAAIHFVEMENMRGNTIGLSRVPKTWLSSEDSPCVSGEIIVLESISKEGRVVA